MAKPTQGSLDTSYAASGITLDAAGTIKKNGKTVGNVTPGVKGGKPVVVVYVPPQPPVVIPADDPNVPNVTDTVIETAAGLIGAPPPAPVTPTMIQSDGSNRANGTEFFHVGPMYHGNHH